MMAAFGRRRARPEDFDLLRRLHRAGMKVHVAALWGWDEAYQESYLRRGYDPARMEVLVRDGLEIGMVQISRAPGCIRLDNILIDPAAQRQGIGSAVIAALVAEAAQSGAELRLSVLRPNPARALYGRLGFVVEKEDDLRIGMVHRAA